MFNSQFSLLWVLTELGLHAFSLCAQHFHVINDSNDHAAERGTGNAIYWLQQVTL